MVLRNYALQNRVTIIYSLLNVLFTDKTTNRTMKRKPTGYDIPTTRKTLGCRI